jgi:hypothetical protein
MTPKDKRPLTASRGDPQTSFSLSAVWTWGLRRETATRMPEQMRKR